jgi:predicted nucleotidyltransferase
MNQIVAEHRSKIAELCRKFGVRELALFGSAVGTDFDASDSDIDFVVDFGDTPKGMNAAQQYFGLLASFEQLFARHVDLVEARALKNRYMIREIARTKVAVYAS